MHSRHEWQVSYTWPIIWWVTSNSSEHLCPEWREPASHELENQLEDFVQENIIIAGDFNCALSVNDKKDGNPVWKKSIVIKDVQHLANLYNLTDIWRDRNPKDNRFTWRNKSLKIQCRLDFFLISKELSSDTHACNIINASETDHSAITLHLKTEENLIILYWVTKTLLPQSVKVYRISKINILTWMT